MELTLNPIKGFSQEWVVEHKQLTTPLEHAERGSPTISVVEPVCPHVVLGSSEREKAFMDFSYMEREGIQLASRRSGGGAVIVIAEDLLWLDVFVPTRSRFWLEDIKRSSLWMGGIWLDALQSISVDCLLYDGQFIRSSLSDLVCFAGKGPGEIFINDQKIVGISQRRSRQGTQFQCGLILNWNPGHLINIFKGAPIPDVGERIQASGTGAGCSRDEAFQAFLSQLSDR